MGKAYSVYIQVIKVYGLAVEAESEEEAIIKAEKLSTLYIQAQGILCDVYSDYATLMDENGKEKDDLRRVCGESKTVSPVES